MTITLKELKELKEARDNVKWLLENDGLIDMKGIAYWAKRIEELRDEIKKAI